MASRIWEQEELMELVQAGACRTVLESLDKQQVKHFPPYLVSQLTAELILQNTRSAKELAELLIENGRLSWNEKNDEGNRIHTIMIWYGTADLAFKAVKGLRKRDIRDPRLSSVWTELLWWFLDKHQRAAAMLMLNKGIMKYMDDDELEWVARKILAYHDMALWEAAWKYTETISIEVLPVPETLSERQFMKELLNTYSKYVELQGDTKKLWDISLECEAENMVKRLLKKTKDYQYLPKLAAGSDELFDLLLDVQCRPILDEVKKEVLFGALRSREWKSRFEMLVRHGWKKSLGNRKQDILIAAEYSERTKSKKYRPDKFGNMKRMDDKRKVRFVKGYEQEQQAEREKKKNNRRNRENFVKSM